MLADATRLQGEARRERGGRFRIRPGVVLVSVLIVQAAAGGAVHAIESHTPAHVRAAGTLNHRVAVLTKALDLDARQRTELLAILEGQRQAVIKIWSDPALLPAERTPATRAVEQQTADQIRGILSEEQRKRYNPPRPHGAETPSPTVEEWMRKQTPTQAGRAQ